MLIPKNQFNWTWVLLAIVVMVISALTAPDVAGSNQMFIGAIAGVVGGLAKGAVGLFSGRGKAARKEAKEAKKDAKAEQRAAELKAKEAQIRGETATVQAKTTQTNIMNIIKQYWWIGALVIGAIVLLPMLKKKVGSGSRSRGSRVARAARGGSKGTAWSRKMLAARRRKASGRKTKRK